MAVILKIFELKFSMLFLVIIAQLSLKISITNSRQNYKNEDKISFRSRYHRDRLIRLHISMILVALSSKHLQLCIDYKALNGKTRVKVPFSHIEEIVKKLLWHHLSW